MITYAISRDQLCAAGYRPIPILHATKRPAITDWQRIDASPSADYYGNGHGVGLVCGVGPHPICGVDLDILDRALVDQMSEYVSAQFGATIERVGLPPKLLLVYRYDVAGIRKITSKRYKCGRVEILGAGQQFLAYGTHPDTMRPYEWPGVIGGALDMAAHDLPVLTEQQARQIVAEFERLAEGRGYKRIEPNSTAAAGQVDYDPTDPLDARPPIDVSQERLWGIVNSLDPDVGRDTWIRVGMALHHQYHGSSVGLLMWDEWSSLGLKYKEGECERFWGGFGTNGRAPVTAAYLLSLAKGAAEAAPAHERIQDTNPADTNIFRALPRSIDRFSLNPAPLEMIVDGMLPRGITSMLYSAGGAGKSTLLLYWAARIALAKKFDCDLFGHGVQGGSVVIVTAEDPDVVSNRRLLDVAAGLAGELGATVEEIMAALVPSLYIIPTVGHPISFFTMTEGGNLATTQAYDDFVEVMREIADLRLIVIDTKTRFSPGEGGGNVIATQEIAHYEAIAQSLNATVMLLHHTNKTSRGVDANGMQAFRDASALYDTVRAAWMLTTVEDADALAEQGVARAEDGVSYLMLECTKQSYLPKHSRVFLTRRAGRYEVKNAGPKLTAKQKKAGEARNEKDKFIEVLQGAGDKALSQSGVVDLCQAQMGIGRRKTETLIDHAIGEGWIKEERKDKKYEYHLTKAGRQYGLTIEGSAKCENGDLPF